MDGTALTDTAIVAGGGRGVLMKLDATGLEAGEYLLTLKITVNGQDLNANLDSILQAAGLDTGGLWSKESADSYSTTATVKSSYAGRSVAIPSVTAQTLDDGVLR